MIIRIRLSQKARGTTSTHELAPQAAPRQRIHQPPAPNLPLRYQLRTLTHKVTCLITSKPTTQPTSTSEFIVHFSSELTTLVTIAHTFRGDTCSCRKGRNHSVRPSPFPLRTPLTPSSCTPPPSFSLLLLPSPPYSFITLIPSLLINSPPPTSFLLPPPTQHWATAHGCSKLLNPPILLPCFALRIEHPSVQKKHEVDSVMTTSLVLHRFHHSFNNRIRLLRSQRDEAHTRARAHYRKPPASYPPAPTP